MIGLKVKQIDFVTFLLISVSENCRNFFEVNYLRFFFQPKFHVACQKMTKMEKENAFDRLQIFVFFFEEYSQIHIFEDNSLIFYDVLVIIM